MSTIARAVPIQCLLGVLGLFPGCVIVVPHTTTSYDTECQVVSRHVELKPVQIAAFARCSDEDCGALLVLAGAAAVGSAIVSGSVAVVGNAVFWLEKQGQCVKPAATSPTSDV